MRANAAMERKHIWTAAPAASRFANTPARRICFTLYVFLLLTAAYANTLPDLPGEELTQERFDSVTRRGGILKAEPVQDSGADVQSASSMPWLDAAMGTWYAPALSAQMAADETIIPFGKGGLFVPRYSETNSEPDVEVYDLKNHHLVSARTGGAITLIPGDYDVTLGSGSQQQRIVKRVTVVEGRMTPVIPDWSGLIVEVVNEQGIAFKGEYELVRIDEFDPYGRGYGASVELGETVKAWILNPGTYKILGAGESYNTMTNFVTVRLLPGELTNFLLIQDSSDNYSIRGGGTLQLASATRSVTSNWHWGANVGANVLFNAEFDHQANLEMNSLTMGLLFDTWVFYRKKPVEWNTRLRLDESINIADNDPETMINTPDRVMLSSIFIWRILNWFGPYARSELNTRFFETKVKRGKEDHFSFVDANYVFDGSLEDTSLIFVTEPAFSPVIVEIGAGVNADLATRRYLEARARAGFNISYSRYAERYRVIEADKVKDYSPEGENRIANSVILYPEEKANIFEVGPQTSFGLTVRIGTFASAEAEIKLFAPFAPSPRIDRPDFDFNGTLSWRLSSFLNLDYTYRQTLRQPVELDVPDHKSSHGIWLRLHFSSR